MVQRSPFSVYNAQEIAFKPQEIIIPSKEGDTGIFITGQEPDRFYPLSSDVKNMSNHFQTRANFKVGDWIELRSDHIFTDNPNRKRAHLACLRRITHKSGWRNYTYQIDGFITDDYLLKDKARVGKPEMIQDVTLDCPKIHRGKDHLLKFGIYIKYAANIKIIKPEIIGTKANFANDRLGASAIKIIKSMNVHIFEPTLMHIGWYGIEMGSCTENVYVEGGGGFDCRHTISVNWTDTMGRPSNISIYGMHAEKNTLSSFDTHDVGNHIVFENCTSIDAGDDGFQFRTPKVVARNCVSHRSYLDGFSTQEGADYCIFENCSGKDNKRVLFNTHSSKGNIII